MRHPDKESVREELQTQIQILGFFVTTFWVLEILDQFIFQHLMRGGLDRFGIVPYNLIGLRGILFAPFLHGGWGHLIANTVPFLILGWLVMVQQTRDFFTVTAWTMVVAGLGTWLLGSPGSVHIGASGLIYGYFGFLLFRGYFERNIPSIALSLLVFFLYGSVIWGVLPGQPGISWQGHLFGFIGGVLAARSLSRVRGDGRI
ncbi:rhomboid family intramembrane serine protease [Spirulina sp. CCNP1310]|uniref:rhomboid family intramembrane serine protease n=1 Tax=Spirulina sp. CCNP1310 TaxID=3110249 RepID=UPI002B1FE5F8|nr:rhomboid family intramembrane serine protease [Spirulina sp. CCNP1310]MEA5419239.1 rhomboid family intramembrane serine protease [Spirulina sp. CCNP1310]